MQAKVTVASQLPSKDPFFVSFSFLCFFKKKHVEAVHGVSSAQVTNRRRRKEDRRPMAQVTRKYIRSSWLSSLTKLK